MNNKTFLQSNEKLENGKFSFVENFSIESNVTEKNKQIILAAKENPSGGKRMLKPRISAIHEGRTANHHIFNAEKLRGDGRLGTGVFSFTQPYPKPMLKNHDTSCEPLGRITYAEYKQDATTGKGVIIIAPDLTDEDAIEKVLDGRYKTVSIGCTTNKAICNICGTDIISEGWCDHYRGEEYDGVIAGWILGDLDFYECSFVNVPADKNAGVIDAGEVAVMEAFAIDSQQNVIDLSKDENNIIVKEHAEELGLLTINQNHNSNKGGHNQTMITQEQFDALQQELNEAKESLVATQAELAIAQTDLATATEQVATLTSEKETLISDKIALEATVATLTAEKDALETDKATLNQQILDASEKYHNELVSNIVAMQTNGLGRTEEELQSMIAKYTSRSTDSLKDTMSDLISERRYLAGVSTLEYGTTITSPVLSNLEVPKPNKTKEDDESITNPGTVIKGMFTGSYRK